MKSNMLIVDDAETNRMILRQLLLKKYQDSVCIFEAENGMRALELIEAQHECGRDFEMILLDIFMPGMNGLEVLEKKQELDYFAQIPVVIITSSETAEDQVEAFKRGASDYITKPFDPEIVIARVDNVRNATKRMKEISLERQDFAIKASLDQMTGMYNKVSVTKLAKKMLLEEPEGLHAMMVLDVDNFKTVNDRQGHLVGDHTLKIIADLVMAQFRKEDIVGRIGGDEFMIVMRNVPDKSIARKKAADLVRLLRYKPNLTIPANVTLSIGLAFSDRKEIEFEELFRQADSALLATKDHGKCRYMEYGVEDEYLAKDDRKTILVLSRNRRVCGNIAAALENQVRLIEVGTEDALEKIWQDVHRQLSVVCIDVSDGEETEYVWEKCRHLMERHNVPMVAVCKESYIDQYKMAIENGAKDIISTPVDVEAARRRFGKLLAG